MPLDLKLLDSLLHEAEGTSLDFKSAQYPFENAHDGEKAGLLKDILAFANSWRRTSAYILIGVEEVNGGRSNVVGVEKHLDDASLHQFVNGKTQRPVEFSYQAIQIDGITIGAIEVPLQKRPIYLKRRFDRLAALDVFIRDGSSTRAATPEEIAKMGAEEVISDTPMLEPKFRIWLVDNEGCKVGSIESEYPVFEPMDHCDVLACMRLLKSKFPPETEFGSRSPAEKEGNTVGERLIGLKYLYTPASEEEIARYTEEEYPRWITECEEYLSRLHDLLQSEIKQPRFTFAVVNEGNRPGRDTLIDFIAEGEFMVCPPLWQDDAEEDREKIEISLPTPPQPPKGRWSPMSPSLRGLSKAMSILANPHSQIRGLSYPGLVPSVSLLAKDNNRRDPNTFYYKPNRSTTPEQSFSLECEQLRHGTEEKHFSGQLFFDLDEDKVSGVLACEVHAENLSSPVKMTVQVEIAIKRLSTANRAQLLIQDSLKAAG